MADFESNNGRANEGTQSQDSQSSYLKTAGKRFALHGESNPLDVDGRLFGKKAMEAEGPSIRLATRIPLIAFVAVVFLVVSAISYKNVSADELGQTSASMKSEVNYLCLQLESQGERVKALERVVNASGAAPGEASTADSADYRLLSDPVGSVLTGYTLDETGTVCVARSNVVVASDDERLPSGTDLKSAIGEKAYGAIDASIAAGKLQEVPLEGKLAEPNGDQEGYLLAGRQGDYTVVIIEPSSMVFQDRNGVIGREAFMSLIILIAVVLVLDRLLVLLVARRIEKTNAVLERITEGDLDARVEEKGVRELRSLAQGINVTVDALKSWFGEAQSRMHAELATARTIQESALPCTFPAFPDIPRFDLYASMDPAREVGGDFYDFFLVGEGCTPEAGKLAFVVADVSGKGIPAALFMMKAKALIRDYLNSGMELGAAVAEANRSICQGNDAGMFVTAWIGVLDYATGHVDYVNAGHNPPLLRQRTGGWRWMKKRSGVVLGLFDRDYEAYSVECEPGDVFLLYTDGVTEAYDAEGTLYGEDRLFKLVSGSDTTSPQELQRLVRDDVAAHAEGTEQSDDVTILVLEVR